MPNIERIKHLQTSNGIEYWSSTKTAIEILDFHLRATRSEISLKVASKAPLGEWTKRKVLAAAKVFHDKAKGEEEEAWNGTTLVNLATALSVMAMASVDLSFEDIQLLSLPYNERPSVVRIIFKLKKEGTASGEAFEYSEVK